MNRARATIEARKPLVNTGSMSGRSRQPSAGSASRSPTSSVEHVRRGVHLDVQRPPQRDPHGRVVGLGNLLISHGAQPTP